MSRFQDEEEDELQMILEGRDVEEYREYIEYEEEEEVEEEDRSQHSETDSHHPRDQEPDEQKNKSFHSKKRKVEDNQRKDKNKRKVSSQTNSEIVNHFRSEEYNSPQIDANNDNKDENETKIKPKIRRSMKPRQKLNADKLMSNEGLAILPEVFSQFKFGQKGSELKDLNAILFRLSHWSHRLFPSFTFDDFIEKCEQLGNKKPVKTFVKKIRFDLPLNLIPNETQLEDNDRQNQNSDLNDKDFDYIIANTYVNTTEDNEKEELPNDSNLKVLNVDQHIEGQSSPINVSELEPNHINRHIDKHIDDSSDEEMSEEQLLKELNSEDDTN